VKAARRLLPLAVSAALLGLLAWRLDLATITAQLRTLSLPWLLLAASLGPAQVLLGGVRWARVSAALEVPLATGEAVREVALSTALNQLLPGGMAGDALRVWRQRHLGARAVTVAAVVDRALGLGTLLVVTWGGILAWQGVPAAVVLAVAGVTVGAIGLLLTAPGAPVRRCLGADGPAQLLLSAVLTASFVAGYAAAAKAVGVPVQTSLVLVVPLVLLAMAVPLSFAGWGPRELAAAVLWPAIGASAEEGVAVAAAYGLSVLLGALPGLTVALLPGPVAHDP